MAANSTLSLPLTTVIPGLNMSDNTTSLESCEYDHSTTIAVKVILGLVLVPIQLTAFITNLLVISTILTDTVLSERKSYLFLTSLASADFLLSVMVLPFAVVNDIHGSWVFSIDYCLVWMTLGIICVTASILNLCLVSIDRYMLIAWYMYYNTHVTRGRVKIVICVVWLIAFIIAFAPLALRQYYAPEDGHMCILKTSFTYAIVSSMFSFYIPCISILIVYAHIYVIARSHASQISQFHFHQKHSNDYKPSKAISRGNRTLGILLGVFLFCWLPFFIAYPISTYLDYQVPEAMLEVCKWLGYSHSCANPIIYSRFNHEIREVFCRKLHFYRKSMADMSATAAAPAGFTTHYGKRKSYRPDVLLSASDVTMPSSCSTWASVPAQLAQPTPVHSQETLARSFSSLLTMNTWFHSKLNQRTSTQSLRAQSVFVHPRQKMPTSSQSMHVLHVAFQSQRSVPDSVQCEQKSPTSVKSQQTLSGLGGQASPSALSPHASSLHVSSLSVAEWQMLTISPSPPPPASQIPVSSSATCQLNPSPPPPPPPPLALQLPSAQH